MYFPVSGVERSDWCSDRNPQGTCKPLTNVCKPMDVPTAEAFKELQRELNRALFMRKAAPLRVDARPGPKTVKAANLVLGTGFFHCDELCASVEESLQSLKTQNTFASAPATVPGARPPIIDYGSGVDKGALEKPKVSTAGIGAAITSPLGLVAIGMGVLLYMKSKKKGKKDWFSKNLGF